MWTARGTGAGARVAGSGAGGVGAGGAAGVGFGAEAGMGLGELAWTEGAMSAKQDQV